MKRLKHPGSQPVYSIKSAPVERMLQPEPNNNPQSGNKKISEVAGTFSPAKNKPSQQAVFSTSTTIPFDWLLETVDGLCKLKAYAQAVFRDGQGPYNDILIEIIVDHCLLHTKDRPIIYLVENKIINP